MSVNPNLDYRSAPWTVQPAMSDGEIAEVIGVSRRRIQQLLARAHRKIQAEIEREAAANGQTVAEWLGECA